MATIRKFEELICWQEARILNRFMYDLIREKKFEQNFRLINQILGSAGSIMDNIAEGFDRGSNREFVRFLYYAKGSCAELRSQAYRALDSNYIDDCEFKSIIDRCERINVMIYKLIIFLKNSQINGLKNNDNKNETSK